MTKTLRGALLRAAADDDGLGLGLRAVQEEVVALRAELDLLELAAGPEHVRREPVHLHPAVSWPSRRYTEN